MQRRDAAVWLVQPRREVDLRRADVVEEEDVDCLEVGRALGQREGRLGPCVVGVEHHGLVGQHVGEALGRAGRHDVVHARQRHPAQRDASGRRGAVEQAHAGARVGELQRRVRRAHAARGGRAARLLAAVGDGDGHARGAARGARHDGVDGAAGAAGRGGAERRRGRCGRVVCGRDGGRCGEAGGRVVRVDGRVHAPVELAADELAHRGLGGGVGARHAEALGVVDGRRLVQQRPDCIERDVGVRAVGAASPVRHGAALGGGPAVEAVVLARRHGGREHQGVAVPLGLRGGRARAAVGVVRDGMALPRWDGHVGGRPDDGAVLVVREPAP